MSKETKAAKDFYNKNAMQWAARRGNPFFHEAEFRKFISYFKKGQKILDIGCAFGIHVPMFLGIGHQMAYEGADISSSFLKVARSRYPQLSFRELNVLERSTFPKKKYDGFWAVAVLMHVSLTDWPQMLENIERSMKPGAIGYITVPKERFTDAGSDPRHFEIFTPAGFRKIVGTRGWKVLQYGHKEATQTTDWYWFIVQLP